MSQITLINPRDISVTEWTDKMALDLWRFGPIRRLDDAEQWQRWGADLLNLPPIRGISLPDPYQFNDWRRWAERVNGAFASRSF